MKFYNREKEIKLLAKIQEAAEENAQMVRQRLGIEIGVILLNFAMNALPFLLQAVIMWRRNCLIVWFHSLFIFS